MVEDMTQYVQFRKVMAYEDMLKYCIASLNAVAIIKFVFFLRLNKRISKLIMVFKVCTLHPRTVRMLYQPSMLAYYLVKYPPKCTLASTAGGSLIEYLNNQ